MLFNSQFNYCPLAWMFHNQKLNKITQTMFKNHIQWQFINIWMVTYKDNSVSIHNWNLQVLATEIFKVYTEQEPDILQDIFPLNSQPEYNLRKKTHFATWPIRTVCYGDNSLRYLRPKLWELVPSESKDIEPVELFKNHTKNWIPDNYPCRLCKTYIHQVGFIWFKQLFHIYIYKLFYFCYMQRHFSEPYKTSRMELICENS